MKRVQKGLEEDIRESGVNDEEAQDADEEDNDEQEEGEGTS